jgi:hypothetical protein
MKKKGPHPKERPDQFWRLIRLEGDFGRQLAEAGVAAVESAEIAELRISGYQIVAAGGLVT